MTTQDRTIDWEAELWVLRDWMVSLARRRVSDQHAAEDVVQEVSLGIIRQNPVLEDPQKLRAWLYRAIVRRAADYMRHRYRRDRVASELRKTATTHEESDGLDWLLASESQQQLMIAIQQLADEDRDLIMLKYVQNWSYDQLANRFGINSRAVEYRLLCAKRELRTELRKLNGGEDV